MTEVNDAGTDAGVGPADAGVAPADSVGGELARLMYEASVVIKSEKWGKTEVEAFLQRLGDGVAELKRGLKEDFDPTDPLRQWAAWFEESHTLAAKPRTAIAAE